MGTTTTTILMGFDTIEINLVCFEIALTRSIFDSILGSILGVKVLYWVQYCKSILGAIFVIDVPMNLHLKFHPNRVSYS